MNLNRVLLAGKLTRDIESRQAGQSTVYGFGLAVNRKFKVGTESREDVLFIDCEAWGKTGEVMAQYLTKGRPVFIEGRLQLDQWQDKDGSKRSKIKVVVESFQFVGDKGGEDKPAARSQATTQRHDPVDESQIPFEVGLTFAGGA